MRPHTYRNEVVMRIVKLRDFVLQKLKIFAVARRDAHDSGHTIHHPLHDRLLSAFTNCRTPCISRCATLTLNAFQAAIKILTTNIFGPFISLLKQIEGESLKGGNNTVESNTL